MAGDSHYTDRSGHEWQDTSGVNGWKLVAKIVVPMLLAFAIQLVVIGRWTGSVDATLDELLSTTRSMSERITDVEQRVDRIERERAYEAGRKGQQPPAPDPRDQQESQR